MKDGKDAFLNATAIALTNAQRTEEILAALIHHGADVRMIKHLQAQLKAVKTLDQQFDDTRAEAKTATHTLNTVRDHGNNLYGQHLMAARLAFRNEPMWIEKMELIGTRQRALPKWLKQVSKFYHHAPAVQDTLTAFRVPAKEVAEMQKLLTQMEELQTLQVDLKGHAQIISAQKKQALATLRQDMARFYRIAKITFDAAPQHLEVLGLSVKASV